MVHICELQENTSVLLIFLKQGYKERATKLYLHLFLNLHFDFDFNYYYLFQICFHQIGDQVIDVNGESFLDVTHSEAVVILKSSRQLTITLRSKEVGVFHVCD